MIVSCNDIMGSSDTFVTFLHWSVGKNDMFCWTLHWCVGEYQQCRMFDALIWWGLMTHSIVTSTNMMGPNDMIRCTLPWYDGVLWHFRLLLELQWWGIKIN